MSSVAIIGLVSLAIVLWVDSMRAREVAVRTCANACKLHSVQFLDQTVALARIRIRWLPQGLRLRRTYRFEYSDEGLGRRDGHVTLTGRFVDELSMGLPTDPTEQPPGM